MIYLFDDDLHSLNSDFEKKLPLERLEKAKKYRREIDKNLCIISYMLFYYGINKEYGIKEKLKWQIGKNYKPFLQNYQNIFFNISHCNCGCLCAIDNSEIGIDIQDYKSISLKNIIFRVCSDDEIKRIKYAKNSQREFCLFWTLKESYVKYTGNGISDNLKDYNFSDVNFNIPVKIKDLYFSAFEFDNYIIAVCSKKKYLKEHIIKLSQNEIC
jgi:4'-phosphopantetheinyl transferase